MLAPLTHLPDDPVTKYHLQLNLYRRLLQTHYGMSVSRMVLAGFSPQQEAFCALEVPHLDAEVDVVLAEQVRRVRAADSDGGGDGDGGEAWEE